VLAEELPKRKFPGEGKYPDPLAVILAIRVQPRPGTA